MIDICREEGVPEPVYESDGYTVKITFWKSTIQKTIQKDAETMQKTMQKDSETIQNGEASSQKTDIASQKTSQKDWIASQKNLSASQKTILEMALENANVTTTEMAKRLGIDRRNVQEHIKKLHGLGLLRREGGRKNGRWVVMLDIDNENEE